MEALNVVERIIRDLLIFVGVLFALLIAGILIISRMPADNPLRQLLVELCRHIGVTMAAGLAAIPLAPIPGVDVAYDTVVPLALAYYWVRFLIRACKFIRVRMS